MSKQLDFVAVGDITTDAFIELNKNSARVVCDASGRACQLVMNFGDKLPYDDVTVVPAVGNSPNASVSAHRLGLSSALVSNLGDDEIGEKCLKKLDDEGVSNEFVRIHEGKHSNYHYVLRYNAERTILVKHHEYPYKLPSFPKDPRYMYLSSLGTNSIPFHHEIADFIQHGDTKLVFQPGTFQIKLGYETLKDIYHASELFFCNKEEAREILYIQSENIEELLKGVHDLGPRIVVITDGPKGAYAYDGKDTYYVPMYPDLKDPVDRTGAGDSFSSTFTAALALGKSIPEALLWGPINSMSVVQYVGAQEGLLSREKLEELLKEAPRDYTVVKL